MSRSSLALAALATVAIPGIEPVATQKVSSTTDFDLARVVDSHKRPWTVKAPRSTISGAAMEGELALLENLSPLVTTRALPFSVPAPQGFAALPEGGRAAVYPEIPGDCLTMRTVEEVTPSIAEVLGSIHTLPISVVTETGLPTFTADECRQRTLSDIDEAAQTGHVPRSLTSRWTTACESPDLWTFTPTVVHGDLAPEHILTDGDRVVGVIEWAAAHVGDPAHDFAPLLAQASDQATKLLIDSYLGIRKVEDPYLLARSVLSSELALLRWLMHGIRIDNDDIVADADSMLVDLAQAAENAEPISEICLTNDTAQVSAPNRSHVAPGSSAIALTPTASATLPVDDHPTMELPIDSDH